LAFVLRQFSGMGTVLFLLALALDAMIGGNTMLMITVIGCIIILVNLMGGIEAVISALVVSRNLIPPTINLDNPDPDCDLDYVPHKARDRKVTYALSNSFGFGGHNASLIVKKFEG